MKALIAISALALLAGGCATDPNAQYAKADCKIAPITTTSVTGTRTRPPTSLEQRDAEMQLGTSQYRFSQLNRYGRVGNNTEEALYDCNSR